MHQQWRSFFLFPLWDGSRVQVGKLYGFIVIRAADDHLHWTVHYIVQSYISYLV